MAEAVQTKTTGQQPTPPEQQPARPAERSPLPGRPARLRDVLRTNGFRWFAYSWAHSKTLKLNEFLLDRMRRIELAKGVPGSNRREDNRRQWNSYDWSRGGEEWTVGPEWRRALIDEVMLSRIPVGASTLEIGPGGGRWTSALHDSSGRLTLVDIAEKPIEICRERFGRFDNVEFHVTDGSSLAPLADDSIDFVWSFDVWVHIAPVDQDNYLRDLARIMRPGARAVIHHAGEGGLHGGWRSSMTAERFDELLARYGFSLIERFDSWGPRSQFKVPVEGDVVSVFEKPA